MAFVKLLITAFTLKKLKIQLEEEKKDAIKIAQQEKPKKKLRHIFVDIRIFFKKIFKKVIHCFCLHRFCFKLQHYGSIENYILKSIVGFLGGFMLTYIFFLFSVFQLNFKITTATAFCAVLGCILMIGLAFSCRVRCIVLLTLPQFFSEKGRQALLAYAFILAISGPAKNTLNNMGILSESLACGQEQLKTAVRQIIDVIKKPFYAIKDAIKKVIKTVKEIIKKIKEILLKIKRIIMAIVRVIKACFQFLAKIINICNKELGTPFERCTRVFENAILDCNAKLGPLFNWMCSLAYIVQAVCYLVKPFDLVCMIVDFISNSVIGVVIRKVKQFVRHIKTMFYVRIRFSHSFHFQTNSSKSIAEISEGIIAEIKDRTEVLQDIFQFLTSAASLFFMFIIFKVVYYRYKFLTSERFDNKYITKDFHEIDLKRAKLGKETVLPLNNREVQVYIQMNSGKLVKTEKKARSKAISTLMTATIKIGIYMASDYSLFWVLNLIKYYGRFQSKVQGPNMPTAFITGKGLLADLLRSIVNAFQPAGIQLEIDTVPCLPTPIPPDLDRYVQIATLLLLCWILTLLEPYGLRFRHKIMSYYHPKRARQRSIWLYNHIMRSRNSFLKFARRQLKRILFGSKGIEKVTCKEYLAANFKICALCFDKPQVACLVCGEVFRENDTKKPIKCHTPGCIGVYCKECFKDLQNLCTVCLSPIEYGDLSDIEEEKDSSEEELQQIKKTEKDSAKKETKWKCLKRRKKSKAEEEPQVIPLDTFKIVPVEDESKDVPFEGHYYSSEEELGKKDLLEVLERPAVKTKKKPEETKKPKKLSWFEKCRGKFAKKEKDVIVSSSDEEYQEKLGLLKEEKQQLLKEETLQLSKKDENIEKPDSDYYSSDVSTDYSYSYQDVKKDGDIEDLQSKIIPFKDVEKQDIPDYASLESFREEPAQTVGTTISDTFIQKSKEDRHVKFIGVPEDDTKPTKLEKKKDPEEMPLIDPDFCFCSDSEDTDNGLFITLPRNESDLITLPRSSTESTEGPIEKVPPFGPLSLLSDIPTPSEICSCPKSSSEMFLNVQFEEISESPRSTFSSRNLSSSSYISSSPNSESPDAKLVQAKHARRKEERDVKTVQFFTVGLSSQSSKNIIDTRQRKKVQDYYKAIRDIPVEKVQVMQKGSRIKHFVQKIVSKRKNLGELPLHLSEDIELKSYSRPPTKLIPPQCTCVPPASIKTAKPPEGKTERQRGGGRILGSNSYYTLVKEKFAHRKYLGFNISELSLSQENWNSHYLDVDLTPTRDTGFLMTKDDSIELATEATERSSREFQGRANDDQIQEFFSPISSTENIGEKTSSSNLSTEFCVSILGRPCTTRKQKPKAPVKNSTPPDITTNHKPNNISRRSFDESPKTQENLEIGKISLRTTLEPNNNQNGKVGTNNSKSVADSHFEGANIDTKKDTIDTNSGASYKSLAPQLDTSINSVKITKNNSISNQKSQDLQDSNIPIQSILEKSSIPSYKSQDIQDQLLSNIDQENLNFEDSQNRSQQTSHPSISKNTSPVQNIQDESQQTSHLDLLANSSSKPDPLINLQDKSQQTSHPTILKQPSPLQKPFVDPSQFTQLDKISTEKVPSNSQEKVLKLENYQEDSQKASELEIKLPVTSPVSLMEKNNQKGYHIPMASRIECKARCARKEKPERDIDHYYISPDPEKLIITSDKNLQTSYNDLLQRSPSCRCGLETQKPVSDQTDTAVNTLKSESIQTQIATSNDARRMPTETSSSAPACRCCCKCEHQYWDSSYKKNIGRYPSEKSLLPSRHSSPKRRGAKHRERQYSPCEFRKSDGRRKMHVRPYTEVPRERMLREDLCRCKENCRCYVTKKTKLYPRPPPLPPPPYKYSPYQFQTNSSDEESEVSGLENDVVEDEEEYYSDHSASMYDLPYQNNSEYLDLVQELEETLQNRSRSRVKRAMKEFEHKSKYNRPLDKPIIKYDETSESEEPLIQKISELTEKKKCCVSGKTCNCAKHNEKHPRNSPRPKSKDRSKSRNRRKPKKHSGKTHWQMDDNSGQWFKVPELYPKRKGMLSRAHSPKEYCPYDCNCCISKNYR